MYDESVESSCVIELLFLKFERADQWQNNMRADDLQDTLKLSDEQIQDLMFIRQVSYAKHHLLSMQREAVACKILEHSPTPVVNVNKIAASAIKLEQQAVDEHNLVLRVKWAIHCGVCYCSCHCDCHCYCYG